MAKWFYYDTAGVKRGPLNAEQLKTAVAQQLIYPGTLLEDDFGHRGVANQLPGLFSVNQATPVSPATHNQPTNPRFVIIKNLDSINIPEHIREKLIPPKNRILAGLLSILFGWFGAHRFYLGSWGSGLTTILLLIMGPVIGACINDTQGPETAILTFVILVIFLEIVGLIDGIKLLNMNQNRFATEFSRKTESPFRTCGSLEGILGCGCLLIIALIIILALTFI